MRILLHQISLKFNHNHTDEFLIEVKNFHEIHHPEYYQQFFEIFLIYFLLFIFHNLI